MFTTVLIRNFLIARFFLGPAIPVRIVSRDYDGRVSLTFNRLKAGYTYTDLHFARM